MKHILLRNMIFIALVVFGPGALLHGASCGLGISGLSFGPLDVTTGQPRDSSAPLTVTCTGTAGEVVSYTISASLPPAYASTRSMTSGGNTLLYNLFVDPPRTIVFGDGTLGSTPIGDSMTLSSSQTQKTVTVYSRIEGHQNSVPAGTYADTVVLTISY